MEKIVLFKLKRSDIKISMEIYFNIKGQLIFDGYDTGKTVDDWWGDSDYEFWRTYKSDQFGKMLGHLIKVCFEREIFTRESQFESWCEERGIKSSFQSYV